MSHFSLSVLVLVLGFSEGKYSGFGVASVASHRVIRHIVFIFFHVFFFAFGVFVITVVVFLLVVVVAVVVILVMIVIPRIGIVNKRESSLLEENK